MDAKEADDKSRSAAQGRRGAPRLVSLRHNLFMRFGVLVAAAVLLSALGYLQLGVRPVALRIADSHFDLAAQQVETSLERLFRPAEYLIGIARQWALSPGFAPDRAGSFNRLFFPILKQMPQITSAVAGTSDGEGWMLLQLSDNRWLTRLTDIPRHGELQQFITWQEGGAPAREFLARMPYDPRQRPWFRLAAAGADDGRPHWTEPYAFFTTKDPGITVSARRDLPDGRTLVVGFDIKLLDLSLATSAVRVGGHGCALVLTADGRVLGLPRGADTSNALQIRQQVLESADALRIPAIRAGMAAWRTAERPVAQILRFTSRGRSWLGTFRPFPLGEQTFWVAAFAPEADFVPNWQPMVRALAAILLLVLGLTLLMARRQARRFSAPLELLAAASERISRLDFTNGRPLSTPFREIDQLARAQNGMRDILRDFRDTVMTQAAERQEQIAILRATETRLQETLSQEQAILDNALVGILFTRERRIVHHNRRLAELLGYAEGELQGHSTEVFYPDREEFLAVGQRAYATIAGGENFIKEMWFHRKDGSRFWGHLSGRALDATRPLEGSVWIIVDLTERKQAEEQLQHLGHHDPLTDLPNRLLFNDRLVHAIQRAQREAGWLALLFIDLDDFKNVNDTLGHQFGDRLLCAVAERLGTVLRNADTLARLGGDEFIVLIEQIQGAEAVAGLAGKLLGAFAAPLVVDGRSTHITGSIGISMYPTDGTDPAALIRNADIAMYQAKASGRQSYRFYSEEMTRQVRDRLEMEEHLRRAIAGKELQLHFQPLVRLHDGAVTGAEALVRLIHPERGLISPLEFIPLAEETGLIFPLGQWVLEESCRHWASLATAGLRLPRIAVNLSVKQLQRTDFLPVVRETLAGAGVPPGVLEFEVTESLFLESEGAFDLMHALADLGVTLSIDDFGTGYSSLSYLKSLPFGKLKIDKSFISEIGLNADGETLVRTIISLADTLGLEVTAEGIEKEQQIAFLLEEGCGHGQGYLFSAAMPAEDFRAWLDHHPIAAGVPSPTPLDRS